MSKRRLLAFDFEVLSKLKVEETGQSYWFVVIVDLETGKGKVIKNNVDELMRFYKATKNDIWISYNGRNYDLYILKGLLLGMDAGYINDKIILEKKKGYQVVGKAHTIPLNHFDCSTGFHGLKQLEGFMGSEIKESDVSFEIDRPLTDEEEKEILRYCIHDVKETINVFKERIVEYNAQLSIIEAFDLDFKYFNKTKAQLAATVMGAERYKNDGDEFDLRFPDTLVLDKYDHIIDWYNDDANNNYKSKLKFNVKDSEVILGYGGAHGAIPNFHKEGIILCGDVSSLYPSLIIEYGLMTRSVSEPAKYKEIRDTRLKMKAAKNPMQQPYKIVLNSFYGATKDQYNNLFDPLYANLVCLFGQSLLIDWIEKVEHLGTVFNINTDGIFIHVENEANVEKIKEISAEWEKRTRLDLEWETFTRVNQKDVNNYVLINDETGKYKSKGAYLKELSKIDYDLPVVNRALIEYFVHNTPIADTINNENRLIEFQKVVKCGAMYEYASYGGDKLNERVLRVFADTRDEAKGVFKHKWKTNKDGDTVLSMDKIGGTPEKCFIDNGDIKEKLIPEYLDKQYYIDLAQKRLNDFLGIKPPRKTRKKKVKEELLKEVIDIGEDIL